MDFITALARASRSDCVFGARDPMVTPACRFGAPPRKPIAVSGPVRPIGNTPSGTPGAPAAAPADVSRGGVTLTGATVAGAAAVGGAATVGGAIVAGTTAFGCCRVGAGCGFRGAGRGRSIGGEDGVSRTTIGGSRGLLAMPLQRPTVCIATNAVANNAAVAAMDTTMLGQVDSGRRRSNHCGPLVASIDTHPQGSSRSFIRRVFPT